MRELARAADAALEGTKRPVAGYRGRALEIHAIRARGRTPRARGRTRASRRTYPPVRADRPVGSHASTLRARGRTGSSARAHDLVRETHPLLRWDEGVCPSQGTGGSRGANPFVSRHAPPGDRGRAGSSTPERRFRVLRRRFLGPSGQLRIRVRGAGGRDQEDEASSTFVRHDGNRTGPVTPPSPSLPRTSAPFDAGFPARSRTRSPGARPPTTPLP